MQNGSRRSITRVAAPAALLLVVLAPDIAFGQEASQELFTVNNTWMLVATFLVFIMHLGFACLESGLTQAKNTVNILFKNTGVIAIGLITYAVLGFNLMYPGDFSIGQFFGFRWLRSRPGGRRQHHRLRRRRLYLLDRFHLPGDVRGDRGHHRLGCRRRAHQAHVVSHLHDHLRGVDLHDRRFVEVGRRVARSDGFLRLRGLDAGPFGRRLGRARGHHRARPASREIRPGPDQTDRGAQHATRHDRRVPAVAGVVRVQRRVGPQRRSGARLAGVRDHPAWRQPLASSARCSRRGWCNANPT